MFETIEAVWRRTVEMVEREEMVAPPAVSAEMVEAALNRRPSQGEMPGAVLAVRVEMVARVMVALAVTAGMRRRQTMQTARAAGPAEPAPAEAATHRKPRSGTTPE